jgi:hypothetical protein
MEKKKGMRPGETEKERETTMEYLHGIVHEEETLEGKRSAPEGGQRLSKCQKEGHERSKRQWTKGKKKRLERDTQQSNTLQGPSSSCLPSSKALLGDYNLRAPSHHFIPHSKNIPSTTTALSDVYPHVVKLNNVF